RARGPAPARRQDPYCSREAADRPSDEAATSRRPRADRVALLRDRCVDLGVLARLHPRGPQGLTLSLVGGRLLAQPTPIPFEHAHRQLVPPASVTEDRFARATLDQAAASPRRTDRSLVDIDQEQAN